MLKLSKAALSTLGAASSELGELFDELERVADKFCDEAQALIDEIAAKKEAAQVVMDEAAYHADLYHDKKSEKWQESERGEAYAEWRDRLREVADAIGEDIEPPEVQMPDRPAWIGEIGDADFEEFSFDA